MAQFQSTGITGSMSFHNTQGSKNTFIGECSSIYACNANPSCHISIGCCIYPDASSAICKVCIDAGGSGYGTASTTTKPCIIIKSTDSGINAYACFNTFNNSLCSAGISVTRGGVRYSGCCNCITATVVGGQGTGATAFIPNDGFINGGSKNIGIGYDIGKDLGTAIGNVTIGDCLLNISGSNQCCCVGTVNQFPMGGIKEATYNTIIGTCNLNHPNAGCSNSNACVKENIMIGCCISNTPSNCCISYTCLMRNVFMGRNVACFASQRSIDNIGIGTSALSGCSSQNEGDIGCSNVAIGSYSLSRGSSACCNVAIGPYALRGCDSTQYTCNNIALGSSAICNITTGDYNIGIGVFALSSIGSTSCQIGIGKLVARCVTGGTRSIFIGDCAGYCQTTQNDTVVIGPNAMWRGQSSQGGHVVIGADALRSICGGYFNLSIGYSAMSVGCNNTAACAISGGCNTAIGTYAGKCVKGASSSNIFIGFESGPNTCTAISCKFYLGSGLGNQLLEGCLASSGRTLGVCGTLSKTAGSFQISHPDPTKTQTKDLWHSFVESPTAGDNLYRFEVEVVDGKATIDLPDYYKHLNENDQVWVNAKNHFGRAYGVVNQEQTTLTVFADTDGEYNILLIGTRKDKDAVNAWKGTERLKEK